MAERRHLLVLDLDETLLHAVDAPHSREADFRIEGHHVYVRPGLNRFLSVVGRSFELAIWTSASDSYARAVVSHLFAGVDLRFVWSSRRCTHSQDALLGIGNPVKNLAKLKRQGYALERIVMVDDTPEKLRRHYGNLVRVRPYFGEEKDEELELLAKYLPRLAEEQNVRVIEKRRWRDEL